MAPPDEARIGVASLTLPPRRRFFLVVGLDDGPSRTVPFIRAVAQLAVASLACVGTSMEREGGRRWLGRAVGDGVWGRMEREEEFDEVVALPEACRLLSWKTMLF
jgi:hypothetical protein